MPIKEELTLNKLHNLLSKSQLTISTAESCTGGIISSELTKLPNSSLYFIGAIIAYQNTIKENVLGVSSSTLSEYGAVSEQTVREMARGVAKLMNTDLAISISGIAGPGGGSTHKPVGTIWTAYYIKGEVYTKLLRLKGSREENRLEASRLALEEVILYTEKAIENGEKYENT